jgi:peptidoglycan/LPS O-acetylase OafA/YrhL
MIVLINNPVLETYIFSALLLFALIISTRWSRRRGFFPLSVSQELKGLAILMIIFAHVTYALVSDSRFLNPLATMGGVGVNLFLILSGYGLVASALRRPLSIKKFYKKRLLRLYIPFWICLTIFYLLDYFALKIHYDWGYVLRSFLGLFWHADLYADIDSPFWYFSWIVFIYNLVFNF